MKQVISLPIYSISENGGDIKTFRLLYVSDTEPGISRIRKGSGFRYLFKGRIITNKEVIEQIRKIVIPPAWEKVWICPSPKGHIQATGYDTKNRKQYRYHPLWNESKNQTKFNRLLAFGEKLPQLRIKLEEDLSQPGLCESKVIATVIELMDRTYIRIGNNGYEKLYGSYGITTLKDKHVNIQGDTIQFSFKGKKGIQQKISLRNKKLSRIVKQCREIPGKELFQYYDDQQRTHTIDSGQVNAYIREVTGDDFTAKDFRTWAGTLHALRFFCGAGPAENATACKKKIVEALDYVSTKLGNTRSVCKKYYVHPMIVDLYEKEMLPDYCKQLVPDEMPETLAGWSKEEKVLMKILKGNRIDND